MAFPTLTEGGVTINCNYPISEQRANSVIRSEFDGGYVQTRARFTRIRKIWKITYTQLSAANKLLIDNFVTTVNCGADSFDWTNPQDSVTYSVRFLSPPISTYVSYNRWNVVFDLEQV
jgi:phage-related protein